MRLPKRKKQTCLDCGFLTIEGRELTQGDRVMLGMRGQYSVMPAHPERTTCSKNLWVSYDLHYSGDSWEGILEELDRSRNKCPGFFAYNAGLSLAAHAERQEKRHGERIQWATAGLAFLGALIGGLLSKC
jgi:ribosomal protein S27AE